MKSAAQQAVDGARGALVDLSHRIHSHPELAFEEERAAAWCAEMLDEGGLRVEAGIVELPTAFVATAGSGPRTIAICAEYDALPGIGHACGHNVIAAAAVGAGLGLSRIADDLGITIKVFGTPAEENGGGKILMLERGAFDGVDAAMMVHPAPFDMAKLPCLALADLRVRYIGKESHSSVAPERGINAANALVIAQMAIGLLREHMSPAARVHGIVTHGGDAPNIVPGHTSGRWLVREKTLDRVIELEQSVRRCFEAGALATGASLEVTTAPAYSEFRDDTAMMALYQANAEVLGRTFIDLAGPGENMAGSTDMANVSRVVRAIHPMIGIGSFPVLNHQPEFAAFCATPVADQAIVDGATALAWTVVDIAEGLSA